MTSLATAAAQPERPEPTLPPTLLEELLKLLVKAVRAHQLYLPNNPIYVRAVDLVRQAFEQIWQRTDTIFFGFTETAIVWEGRAVLEEPSKGADSLPWLFFKDGIREVTIQAGFQQEEILGLLEIIQRARKAAAEDDDLLTLLWERDFQYLRYVFVDLALESAPSIADVDLPAARSLTMGAAGPADGAAAPGAQAAVAESTPAQAEGIVNLDDFDSTLYFLDDHEITYLQNAVHAEYERDLRSNVIAMLLDVFEQQTDAKVRDEICEIVESMMLHLLSAGHFRAVAYLLRESAASAGRGRDVSPAQKQKLARLPERLSAPDALAQLLQSLDEAAELPPVTELTALFDELRASALATVFLWLARTSNPRLRPLLEQAATRLAGQNTAEVARLVTAENRAVALEAMRRAAALKSPAAVPPLGKVLETGDAELRLAAVTALGEIGSPSALQLLERAIEDEERDVRVATVRAVSARAYRPALARLEAAVRGKGVRAADLTEKMAFFEAYGGLCGASGIAYLEETLMGKGGLFGRREDPEVRACAAMALGRVGTEAALAVLRRAQGESEKEVLVRNAVNRALRGGGPA